MPAIITDKSNYPIQPNHLRPGVFLWDTFGNTETEVSAGWILRFLRLRGEGWKPFTFDELNAFYQQKWPNQNFGFNHLIGEFWVQGGPCDGRHERLDVIAKGEDGLYRVTEEFILRCHKRLGYHPLFLAAFKRIGAEPGSGKSIAGTPEWRRFRRLRLAANG